MQDISEASDQIFIPYSTTSKPLTDNHRNFIQVKIFRVIYRDHLKLPVYPSSYSDFTLWLIEFFL